MNIGLSSQANQLLIEIFQHHPEVERVKIFGSRAIGTYSAHSDIDLVFWGDINASLLATIARELDELSLPYLFDVERYEYIDHAGLKEHIDRVAQDIYVKI